MIHSIMLLIQSAIFALALVAVTYLLFLMINSVSNYFTIKANRDNHYLKKMVKAQDIIIAKLCNSLHR